MVTKGRWGSLVKLALLVQRAKMGRKGRPVPQDLTDLQETTERKGLLGSKGLRVILERQGRMGKMARTVSRAMKAQLGRMVKLGRKDHLV